MGTTTLRSVHISLDICTSRKRELTVDAQGSPRSIDFRARRLSIDVLVQEAPIEQLVMPARLYIFDDRRCFR